MQSGQIQSQNTVKRQVRFWIHVPISVQNKTFNLNKLFLDHKLTVADRQTDRQSEQIVWRPFTLRACELITKSAAMRSIQKIP